MWLSSESGSAVNQFLVKFFQQFVVLFRIAAGAGALTAATDL
jgi:hypothetical protein